MVVARGRSHGGVGEMSEGVKGKNNNNNNSKKPNSYKIQWGILDWITEQRKSISRKTGETRAMQGV